MTGTVSGGRALETVDMAQAVDMADAPMTMADVS